MAPLVGIEGDLGAVVEQLTTAIGSSVGSAGGKSAWISQLRQDRDDWHDELRGWAIGKAPIDPMDFNPALVEGMDEDAIVILHNGDFFGRDCSAVQWGLAYMKARKPGRFMCASSNLAFPAACIPYALGARLAHPEAEVILIMEEQLLGFHYWEIEEFTVLYEQRGVKTVTF